MKHQSYIEPFFGMGGLFFARPERAKYEVINDINGELINMFLMVREHLPQLMDLLKWMTASRQEFDSLRDTDPASLTELQRAARTLVIYSQQFGGKPGSVFGTAKGRFARFSARLMEANLEAIAKRLDRVTIECLDWRSLVDRYDDERALFYFDPPYFDCENYYGPGVFDKDNWQALADRMAAMKAKVVMSVGDHPIIRDLFSGFTIQALDYAYSLNKDRHKAATELVITNFNPADPPARQSTD